MCSNTADYTLIFSFDKPSLTDAEKNRFRTPFPVCGVHFLPTCIRVNVRKEKSIIYATFSRLNGGYKSYISTEKYSDGVLGKITIFSNGSSCTKLDLSHVYHI